MAFTGRLNTWKAWPVLIAALGGLSAGFALSQAWARTLEQRGRALRLQEALTIQAKYRDPELRARDSAAWVSRRVEFPRFPLREVRRVQLYGDCLVSFEVLDTVPAHLNYLEVRANGDRGQLLGRTGAYSDVGYRPGEWVNVVAPDLECSTVRSFALGFGPPPVAPRPPYRAPAPDPAPPARPTATQ
ncbi:MAG TPA: hypothetical protein VHG35_09965 [Gemmatimonadales bacterium]|nr:hypothetical protein [Gemmatimonadales bacterium]